MTYYGVPYLSQKLACLMCGVHLSIYTLQLYSIVYDRDTLVTRTASGGSERALGARTPEMSKDETCVN